MLHIEDNMEKEELFGLVHIQMLDIRHGLTWSNDQVTCIVRIWIRTNTIDVYSLVFISVHLAPSYPSKHRYQNASNDI